MLIFAREIVRLLNTGEEVLTEVLDPSALELVLEETKKFHSREKRRFKGFSHTPLKTQPLQHILETINQAYQKREEGLKKLLTYLKEKNPYYLATGLKEVEEASLEIAENSAALTLEDEKLKFSHIPILDRQIKTAMHIYQGSEPAGKLIPLTQEGVSFVRELEEDLWEFSLLFPREEEIISGYQTLIRLFKGALGAFQIFLDTANKEELFQAGQVLFAGGHEFYKLLGKIAVVFQGKTSYSSLPFVERTLRALTLYQEGKIAKEEFARILNRIRKVHLSIVTSLESLEFTPLSPETLEKTIPLLRQRIARQDRILLKLPEAPELGADYKKLAQAVFDEFEKIKGEQARPRSKLAQAPDFENLHQVIMGVKAQRVPVKYLRMLLEQLTPFLEAAYQSETDEFALNAYHAVYQGIDELQAFFQDKNSDHLEAGWEIINQGIQELITLEKGEQPVGIADTPTIVCLKCGLGNLPETQYCTKCGAYLPYAKNGLHRNIVHLF